MSPRKHRTLIIFWQFFFSLYLFFLVLSPSLLNSFPTSFRHVSLLSVFAARFHTISVRSRRKLSQSITAAMALLEVRILRISYYNTYGSCRRHERLTLWLLFINAPPPAAVASSVIVKKKIMSLQNYTYYCGSSCNDNWVQYYYR